MTDDQTKRDQEAAEDYSGVKYEGKNGFGEKRYSSDSWLKLEHAHIRIPAFLAGIAHERARTQQLEAALNKIAAWGLPESRKYAYPDRWSLEIAREALKEGGGEHE